MPRMHEMLTTRTASAERAKWPAQLERYLEEACRQRYRQQGKINLWLLPGTDCLRALIAYPRS